MVKESLCSVVAASFISLEGKNFLAIAGNYCFVFHLFFFYSVFSMVSDKNSMMVFFSVSFQHRFK